MCNVKDFQANGQQRPGAIMKLTADDADTDSIIDCMPGYNSHSYSHPEGNDNVDSKLSYNKAVVAGPSGVDTEAASSHLNDSNPNVNE